VIQTAAPNQRIVIINRSPKEIPFAVLNFETIKAAARDLDGKTFKLWIYLAMNGNGYKVELSSKDLSDFGLKDDSYYRAVNELIQSGYLVKQSGNLFFFYDQTPQNADFKLRKNPSKTPQNADFKLRKNREEIRIEKDIDNINIGIRNTRDHSAGMIKAETDEERDILAHMRESGFCDLPSSGTPLLTVRQLLGEDHDPEDIKEEIVAVVERSRDKDREPIRDALAYLVTRLNRKENGWSYEDNETLNEE